MHDYRTTWQVRNSGWIRGLLLALPLALSGCIFDPDPKEPDPPEPYPPQTSPQNVLQILRRAYEEKNYEEFEKIFADEYVFEFSPVDVDQGTTPVSWPRSDELDAARNMFTDDTVNQIQFSQFVIPDPVPAVEEDNLPTIEGIFKITVDSVRLSVYTRLPDNDILELLVNGEQAVFFFDKIGDDPDTARWFLVRWRDNPTSGGLALADGASTRR